MVINNSIQTNQQLSLKLGRFSFDTGPSLLTMPHLIDEVFLQLFVWLKKHTVSFLTL